MRKALPAIALGCTAFLATPAAAQQRNCGTVDQVRTMLTEKYHESAMAQGVTSNGPLLTVFASENGATWTVVMTTPEGMSCIMSEGQNLQMLTPETPEAPRGGA